MSLFSLRLTAVVCALNLSAGPGFAAPLSPELRECVRQNTEAILAKNGERLWIDDQVEVIYFPEGQHTKLRFGNLVAANLCPGDHCRLIAADVIDRLSTSHLHEGPQIRFSIRVAPKEFGNIASMVDSGNFGEAFTCAHSVCKTLNKSTRMWIPTAVGVSPAMSATWLALSRLVPGSRVLAVKIVGRVTGKTTHMPITEYVIYFCVATLTGVVVYAAKYGLPEPKNPQQLEKEEEKK